MKEKKIANQSWSLDPNGRRMHFVEFADGTAQCYLNDSNQIPGERFTPRMWTKNYDDVNHIDTEMCIAAARTKSSFTNRVYV